MDILKALRCMDPEPEHFSQHTLPTFTRSVLATTHSISHQPLCAHRILAQLIIKWIMKEIRAMRALLDRCLLSPKKQQTGGGGREPPEGRLAVYVGAARERFVVRTESVNHRLFRALLEEAEEARGPYGYAPEGPLQLPACDAAAFARVVEAIEREMAEESTAAVGCGGIVWAAGHSAAHRTVAAAVIAGGRQVL